MASTASLRLIAAVPDGDEAAARLALADGADPNAVSRVGPSDQPVLARAARDGRLGIVRLLLRAGARVAPPNPYQASALRSAVLRWHADVARLLIDHGALTAEPAGRRMSVLTEALQFVAFQPGPAGLATLRVLLQAGAVSHPEEEAPLVSAIMRRVAPAVLRLLLAHGADADQLRSDAAPAIVVAARRGDHAAVDVLLAAGADVEARDRLGRTALMHAVERDEQQVVAVLVLAGADRDAVSADGMTALRLARGWGRPNMQFMLGEHSATGDEVPIVRTVVRVVPTGVRLTGDPRMLHLLAEAVEIALDDLGDDEWRVRTGWDAGPARTVAARLRAAVTSIDVTSDEFGAVRSALAELAFGTTRTTPAGTTRLDVDDLLDRLD